MLSYFVLKEIPQILPDDVDSQKTEFYLEELGLENLLFVAFIIINELLSENKKVWLVGCQREENQVSVGAVYAVRCVGVVVLIVSLASNEVQNLVFPFSGHRVIAEQNLKGFPLRIVL